MTPDNDVATVVPHCDGAASRTANLTAAVLVGWVFLTAATFLVLQESAAMKPDNGFWAIAIGATLGMGVTGLVRAERAGAGYRHTLMRLPLPALIEASEADGYSRYERREICRAIYRHRDQAAQVAGRPAADHPVGA